MLLEGNFLPDGVAEYALNRSSAKWRDVVNYRWVMKSEPQIYRATNGGRTARIGSAGPKREDPGVSDQTRANTVETG